METRVREVHNEKLESINCTLRNGNRYVGAMEGGRIAVLIVPCGMETPSAASASAAALCINCTLRNGNIIKSILSSFDTSY